MSAISSVSSPTNPYQTSNQNSFGQILSDFNSIGSALQSGDLSTAQSALATFQQDLPANSQTSANQPFGKNSQANTDYQSLTTALQSGNLSAAQTAFASLQKDLKGAGKSHGHHHHHGGGGSETTPPTTITPASDTTSPFGPDGSLVNVTA